MKYSLHVSHGARNDFHMCPMVTPGVPPIPHVGGPILPPCGYDRDGIDECFVGGLPAARIMDPQMHGGMIILGEFTVLIGG
jgi:uncharacterized Zn-binding protein involved in type VI secretion